MPFGPEKLEFQTINLFSVTGKYNVLWVLKICLTTSLFIQHKVAKGQVFTTALQKDKSNTGVVSP